MAGLGGIGEDEREKVPAAGGGKIRLGEIELLMGAAGYIAAHEFSIQIDQGIAVGVEVAFPRHRPTFCSRGESELRAAPGESRDRRGWGCAGEERRWPPDAEFRVDFSPPHRRGET